MGLAVVHGIIKSYGGQIQVESQPAQGKTFRVMLPAADIRREEGPHGRRSDDTAGGSESILLVDDEPQRDSQIRLQAHTAPRSGPGVARGA